MITRLTSNPSPLGASTVLLGGSVPVYNLSTVNSYYSGGSPGNEYYDVGSPIMVGTGDKACGRAVNVDVVYGAHPSVTHLLAQVDYSYSAAPTNGGVVVLDGTTEVIRLVEDEAGPNQLLFNPHKTFTRGNSLTVRLLSGGGTVSGDLSVTHAVT
jgi:hypothetical protein